MSLVLSEEIALIHVRKLAVCRALIRHQPWPVFICQTPRPIIVDVFGDDSLYVIYRRRVAMNGGYTFVRTSSRFSVETLH